MENPQRGKFIVIEGGEGMGKTTLAKNLKKIFGEDRVVSLREPGGTPLGAEVRRILMDPRLSSINSFAQLCLFWASRAQLLETEICPALEKGKIVICDRFDCSTFAYQIRGSESEKLIPLFEELRCVTYSIAKPDLYLFMDMELSDAMSRVSGREDNNHFDFKEADYHKRVRLGYNEYFENNPHEKLNARGTEEEVLERALEILARYGVNA